MPLDEARRMSRGPRIEPELYYALKENIRALVKTATHMPLPEGANLTTMKNRILRMSGELGIPVIVRKSPGGLICWRSPDEELQQAQEIAARLQSVRQPPDATGRGRPRA